MRTITRKSAEPSGRQHTALGFLIAPLIAGRTTARTVLDRYFKGTPIGRRLHTAIRHGSLVDGEIKGPRYTPDGEAFRPRRQLPEDDINRPLDRRAAARMLATFLIVAEAMDPRTHKAAGRHLWQGHHARRIGFSQRRNRKTGTINGTREIQRYVRVLEGADAIATSQPDAENVPEYMRGQPKRSTVRGKEGDHTWAYNVITLPSGYGLPVVIQRILRRWRGEAIPLEHTPHVSSPVYVSPEAMELAASRPPTFQEALRLRPHPDPT